MPRTLILKNKLRAFAGQIDVFNEREKLAYRATSEWSWSTARWRLCRGDRELAVLQRPWFAWRSFWTISGTLGDIVIEPKQWSMRRHYTVRGGAYDGTVISGNLWDQSFVIDSPTATLARASNSLLSLRDRHQVDILDEHAELMCVVAMVVIKADRNNEAVMATVLAD